MNKPKSHAYDSHGVSATELRERLDAAEVKIEMWKEALSNIVRTEKLNTGAEPSVSVFHRTIEEGRRLLLDAKCVP